MDIDLVVAIDGAVEIPLVVLVSLTVDWMCMWCTSVHSSFVMESWESNTQVEERDNHTVADMVDKTTAHGVALTVVVGCGY
jgi:peroxiredoxin